MSRDYGQFCGLARALELVGGRWTLLIVRDLLAGPKRFTDLRTGLPGIPTNVLSARLRELEDAGIVTREIQPRPSSGVAYELTAQGAALEGPIVSLGMWGAPLMGPCGEGDFVSIHALSLGLRGMFQPDHARDVDCDYELRLGAESLRVAVHGGTASYDSPAADPADSVIETDAGTMHSMLVGEVSLDEAIAADRARIDGPRADAQRFFEIFRVPLPAEAVSRPG